MDQNWLRCCSHTTLTLAIPKKAPNQTDQRIIIDRFCVGTKACVQFITGQIGPGNVIFTFETYEQYRSAVLTGLSQNENDFTELYKYLIPMYVFPSQGSKDETSFWIAVKKSIVHYSSGGNNSIASIISLPGGIRKPSISYFLNQLDKEQRDPDLDLICLIPEEPTTTYDKTPTIPTPNCSTKEITIQFTVVILEKTPSKTEHQEIAQYVPTKITFQ